MTARRQTTPGATGRPIPRRAALLLLAAAPALLAACGEPAEAERSEAPAGEPGGLSGLSLRRVGGGLEDLGRHQGKVILLNVWATWCPPCRAEMPALQRLSDALDPARYVVLGLSVDEDADFVGEYLRDVKVRFANYLDDEREAGRLRFGVETLPQTLVLHPDGRLARRIEGVRDWDLPETRREIEAFARGAEDS